MPAPTKQPEGTLGHRRQTLGKGQITIADECGVEQATISRWENGHNFPRDPATRQRMMDAYECDTLAELFGLLATTATVPPANEGTLEYVSRRAPWIFRFPAISSLDAAPAAV